jgi:hypothetical protein
VTPFFPIRVGLFIEQGDGLFQYISTFCSANGIKPLYGILLDDACGIAEKLVVAALVHLGPVPIDGVHVSLSGGKLGKDSYSFFRDPTAHLCLFYFRFRCYHDC